MPKLERTVLQEELNDLYRKIKSLEMEKGGPLRVWNLVRVEALNAIEKVHKGPMKDFVDKKPELLILNQEVFYKLVKYGLTGKPILKPRMVKAFDLDDLTLGYFDYRKDGECSHKDGEIQTVNYVWNTFSLRLGKFVFLPEETVSRYYAFESNQ